MKKKKYRILAKMYGWTFDEIANMTEEQQNIALESDESDDEDSKSDNPNILSFQDQREFEAFLEANPQYKK